MKAGTGMATPTYRRKHKIHFSECDPAGIVFYPQYFVLFNDLVESWFDEMLPEEGYHGVLGGRRVGLPTVRLEVDFKAVSKMGDEVWLSLAVERLGGASLTLAWACTGVDGVLRMSARQTIVTTSLDTHRSIGIPDDIRAAIEAAVAAARG
jgi:4-hydroxybenzoyl-CoA thioesterase